MYQVEMFQENIIMILEQRFTQSEISQSIPCPTPSYTLSPGQTQHLQSNQLTTFQSCINEIPSETNLIQPDIKKLYSSTYADYLIEALLPINNLEIFELLNKELEDNLIKQNALVKLYFKQQFYN